MVHDPGAVLYTSDDPRQLTRTTGPPQPFHPVNDRKGGRRVRSLKFAGNPLSARYRIPNELLDDPAAYFRTSYTHWPDTYRKPPV